MVINRQNIIIIIGILVIAGFVLLFLIGPFQFIITPHQSYTTPYGIVTVPAALPDSPDNLILYKINSEPSDMVFFSVKDLEQTRPNITSEADAPAVAQKSLEQYGGLPKDAKMSLDETEYLDQLEFSRIPFLQPRVIAKYPVSTNVQYSRVINGHPISGDGGFINIELGNDGELLYLDKVWRTVTPSKTVHIISVAQAIEKMQRGEILGMRSKCSCELTVTKIIPTYYEKGRNLSQEYLDPVWVFAGTLSSGDPWHYSVYAWQFANFTYNQASGPIQMTLQFNDTSDSSPSKWFWEFGDGMNATERNPIHSYDAVGSYNVTLTSWNDLGSDTVTKNIVIQNNPLDYTTLNSPSKTTQGSQGASNISN
jgi:hypothetical protein